MEIISFINYKGGVGKTTLTANVAAELAFRGKRVLVVDLDPQTNLTLSFIDLKQWQDLDKEGKTIKHWYDEFLDADLDESLKDLIVVPRKVNSVLEGMRSEGYLHLISSHLELINLDMELATRYGGNSERTIRSSFLRLFSRLKKGLEEVEDEYDLVLIDCPPNFNIVTQNAIIASDMYLVPAKADFLSTLGIDQLVRHIDSLTEKYNKYVSEDDSSRWKSINPQLVGVVFTMINIYKGNPIQAQNSYIHQVSRNGYTVFDNFIRNNNTLFANSPEYGVPVALNDSVEGLYLDIRTEIEDVVQELINRANI
ncbi:MAG: AAA family ATPase [Clostridium perfringens]|uniref:ParA family protein n=1 Tax=Clostridium perfringens TaxID=1502 RepID=UPI0013E2CFBB|nr:AAA family ATPase [Clostridium perfringens]MCC2765714.1 AAA family ATPase [Clostridium perfringens]MCG4543046.1 AAA family ATPase [Clostridium perfringens]MCG4545996.1 AAA family ATPase [Clostridium perfringens]MCG4553810.1 AAA family ATPase [Clostridium perfringens]MCG4557277.1 AAA family ATPase [Clostridium perfringens]